MKKNSFNSIYWMVLSFALTIIIAENRGDELENIVRKFYYNSILTNDSLPAEYEITVDSLGIPYVNYYKLNGITAGKQYNPTLISCFAIQYYKQIKQEEDSVSEKYFFNCIQSIISNLSFTKEYALYKFSHKTPFYPHILAVHTSGISSGLALEALVDAYVISHSKKYLETGKYILNGYYVPIEHGGFTHKNDDGWWYEEYADTAANGPQVLNGHIAALLGAYKYYSFTKNDSAYFLFQQGLKALKNNIHLYDTGENNWSYYDSYKKRADKKYQKIVVAQMKQLYKITHDITFYNYYVSWGSLLKEPYLIRMLKEKNRSGILLTIGLFVSIISAGVLMNFLFTRLSARYKNSSYQE